LASLETAGGAFADDRAGARRTRLACMSGQQMLDERGDAVVLLASEVGVFEEVQIAGAADSSHFTEDEKSFLVKFLELVAAVF
jgi:hypothetical protein